MNTSINAYAKAMHLVTHNMNQTDRLSPNDKHLVSQSNQFTHNLNSAEEKAAFFSEKAEASSKTKASNKDERQAAKIRIEKLEALYSLLAGRSDNKQNEHIQRLIRQAQQGKASLPDLLARSNDDPTKSEVLLELALRRPEVKNDPKSLEHLQQLATQLHSQYGEHINAGINTAAALAQFSQDPSELQNLRNLYYQNVVGQGSVATIFDSLLSQFDEHHFSQGMHTMMRALSDDMSSRCPSLPAEQLRLLLKDMQSCKQLSAILHGSQDLIRHMSRKNMEAGLNAPRLTRRLIDFTQNMVYPRDLKNLSNDAVGAQPLDQLMFLKGLLPLIDDMPPSLWRDKNGYDNLRKLGLKVMTDYVNYERQTMISK